MFSNIFINNQDMIRMSCCVCGCGCDCNPTTVETKGRKGGAKGVSDGAATKQSGPSA